MQVLGLFEKRIEGDDALLQLARIRYTERNLGAEIYAEHPDTLRSLLALTAPEQPVTVHLPRWFDVTNAAHAEFLQSMLQIRRDGLIGYVTHDSAEAQANPDRVIQGLTDLQRLMQSIAPDRMLFFEYAAGIDPDAYCQLLERCRHLANISACIDIGHIGIRTIRHTWQGWGMAMDACSLRPETAGLEDMMPALQKAVSTALPVALEVIERMGQLCKPLHFHLHDGHPLSSLSRFGVSDHLGFLRTIALPFRYTDHTGHSPTVRDQVSMMYGPQGIGKIIACCRKRLHSTFSLTLEIHDQPGRLALGKYANLFSYWSNTENAEAMNFWLEEILANETLLHQQDSQ